LWLAESRRGSAPRSKTLCHGAMATHLSECSECGTHIAQHVASRIRCSAFSALIWSDESEHAFCRPPSCSCAQRVWLLRLRRFGCRCDGRPRRVGGYFHLAWVERPAGTHSDY